MSAELETLIQRYIDGTITADELAVFNQRLASDAEARGLASEWLDLDSAIGAAAAGWLVEVQPSLPCVRDHAVRDRGAEPVAATEKVAHERWRTTILRTAAVAACVLLLLGVGWWSRAPGQAHAIVIEGVGVEELRRGDELRRERHLVRAGTLELLTARGARVVIEAPAEIRFETAQRLHLLRGRLSADVPPEAKGFTVITPSGEAVDLGTRFGVDVPVTGAVEVHVFQGEVVARPTGNSTGRSLRSGDAFTMDGGASAARELRSSAFIQHDEVDSLSAGLAAGRPAVSLGALEELRRDPALVALLDFETDEPFAGRYRTVQGRWPGSRATEFVDVDDHLRLDVGGDREWPRLTLAAWVRLDRLGAPFQSLLHTDGWNRAPGQVHWMVTRHMTMRLALFANTLAPGSEEQEDFPDSRTSVLPERGRWIHLTTVYDSEERIVRFYLNGRFDKETRQAVAHPARLGPAQIGNWDTQDRRLSGRIDEIVILGRAMSDDEVQRLYEAGNPYR